MGTRRSSRRAREAGPLHRTAHLGGGYGDVGLKTEADPPRRSGTAVTWGYFRCSMERWREDPRGWTGGNPRPMRPRRADLSPDAPPGSGGTRPFPATPTGVGA